MCQAETLGIIDEIAALVSDKLQVVSYKWLSRNFLESSNTAKRLLQEFVERHGDGLEVVYSLSGWLKDNLSCYHIKLVSGPKLAAVESKYCWKEKCGFHQIITDDCAGIPKVVIVVEDVWLLCIRFPPDLLKLRTDCLVMQIHHYGISPERPTQNTDLTKFFNVLTTSTDGDNKVYVSTVQAHGYPATAFQWHPEKNAFEWCLSMIPHSDDAIQVTQHVANFFVSEARKSINQASTQKVLDKTMYNYSLTYWGKAGKGYDEVYIFT